MPQSDYSNQVGEQFGLTISSSVVSLTVPSGAARAFIQVETNGVRMSERPATLPTVSAGTLVAAAGPIVAVNSYTPSLVRLIRNGASDSTVNVTYYN